MGRCLPVICVLALVGCGAATGEHLDHGGEVLEASGLCEGAVEAADEGLWRCPADEPGVFYVLLEAGEDAEVLTEMYLRDGAGGQLVVGDEPEPWILDVQDPDVAHDVAERTGGEVVEDGPDA